VSTPAFVACGTIIQAGVRVIKGSGLRDPGVMVRIGVRFTIVLIRWVGWWTWLI